LVGGNRGGRVVADERTNQVLVQVSPADMLLVEKILELLDIPGDAAKKP
jgi:type II secretory pathway component GspD/PulD (secretin)